MTVKKTLTILLLLFVAAAFGTVVLKGFGANGAEKSTDGNNGAMQNQPQQEPLSASEYASEMAQPDTDIDVVYYFMTTQRCPSCMKIEAFTKEAVEQNFTRQLDDRKLLWRMVNVDEPQNNHFIQDYQLFTKSVVLVKIRDGKQVEWKNLDQVWYLLEDRKKFQDYVISELTSFIGDQG